jgi:hypothetical protein
MNCTGIIQSEAASSQRPFCGAGAGERPDTGVVGGEFAG